MDRVTPTLLSLLMLWSGPAWASEHVLEAHLVLASDDTTLVTPPHLREIVQQMRSRGVRSATPLSTSRGRQSTQLHSEEHTLHLRLDAASAQRARVILTVHSDAQNKEIAVEVPKDRTVLVGIDRSDKGFLIASLRVAEVKKGR